MGRSHRSGTLPPDRRAQDRGDRTGHHQGLHPLRGNPRGLHVLLRRRPFRPDVPYAQSYLDYLPQLADLLADISTPVRVVQDSDDQVVPPVNAEFLASRLPHGRVDLIAGAGHFCWEEKPEEYASLVTSWWEVV